ncbi:class II aldolase/adducin family protein [Aminipila butyrica]|uniref:Class II aldolase/adducin family protein n=1 Tax=Aminipila butyrica TaxID=433296 RepID=A0A858BV92_9FIRM|nr:class II aldolase/adducin family protein [Aminipila butyrica]QIB67986.1 class II aldolase/adducin family protein [Aminipila butyrica]
MNLEKLRPAEQLCRVMSRIYDAKLTTVSGGNLSLRDDAGNVWVTPSGGDKGRYQPSEMLRIGSDGQVENGGKPSVETGIHRSLLADRPEFKAVVHAHPAGLVAISLLRQLPELRLLPQVAAAVKEICLAAYGCPGSEELRENVAREFCNKSDVRAAILENHGAFVASEEGLQHAFGIFQDLDFSIRLQAKAHYFSGQAPRRISQEQLERYQQAEQPVWQVLASEETESVSLGERDVQEQMIDFCNRAYARGLFTQNIGVISVRLEENSFLITASGADNGELTPEEIVKVQGQKVQGSRRPSKSASLHQKIYQENPHINAIIMAAPEHAMVFAVTQAEYDLKTIPECYIVLREKIRKFPFGATIEQQEELAAYFKNQSPVAMVENDCCICTGASLFNAFDKLEVLEFSSQAVITARMLPGTLQPITEEQVEEIKNRFNIV